MSEVMAYSLPRERLVRKPSDDVKMDMWNGLPRNLSDIPSDIITSRPLLIEDQLGSAEKIECVEPFVSSQIEGRHDVSKGNDHPRALQHRVKAANEVRAAVFQQGSVPARTIGGTKGAG